jgi:hypothetical protein
VCTLLDRLGVQYERARLAQLVGAREHTKAHQKIDAALPTEEALQKAARFLQLLAELGKLAPRPTLHSP